MEDSTEAVLSCLAEGQEENETNSYFHSFWHSDLSSTTFSFARHHHGISEHWQRNILAICVRINDGKVEVDFVLFVCFDAMHFLLSRADLSDYTS